MADMPDHLDQSAVPLSNAEFFSPAYLERRRQSLESAAQAALVSKYASMLSPHRDRDKKEQDAVDFRRLVRANRDRIRRDDLHRLAGLVWEGGAGDIDRFIEIALSDEPFPN
jgi:hypothetical protein